MWNHQINVDNVPNVIIANSSTTHSNPELGLASHDAKRIFDLIPRRIQGSRLDAHHREERAKAEQQSSDNYKENHTVPALFCLSILQATAKFKR